MTTTHDCANAINMHLPIKRLVAILVLTLSSAGLLIALYSISTHNMIELLEVHRSSPLSKSEVVDISGNTAVIYLTYGFIPGVIMGCACSLLSTAWREISRNLPRASSHNGGDIEAMRAERDGRDGGQAEVK